MRLRKSTCPAPSAPCTWNTCFAMSKPIVVACSMDASFGGSSTPSPWHTDAVGGRPPHHPPFAGYWRASSIIDDKMLPQTGGDGFYLGFHGGSGRPTGPPGRLRRAQQACPAALPASF